MSTDYLLDRAGVARGLRVLLLAWVTTLVLPTWWFQGWAPER